MRIAVDTGLLQPVFYKEQERFVQQVLIRLAATHSEDEFILLSSGGAFINPGLQNVKVLEVYPVAARLLKWKWWCCVKLPALLKKNGADIFVSFNGSYPVSARLPSSIILPDINYLQQPSFFKRKQFGFFQRKMLNRLEEAVSIATIAPSSWDETFFPSGIIDKITPVFAAPYHEADLSVCKDEILAKYTEGKEYFLYAGSTLDEKNLLLLLKAFSLFKHRQKSGMKLMINGKISNEFSEKLHSYKYRDDVVQVSSISNEDEVRLLKSAYSAVYPAMYSGYCLYMLDAMKNGVCVIATALPALEELAGGAALFAKPGDQQSLAEQMMRIYKDETLRKELIDKGRNKAEEYTWERTAVLLYECIMKAKP